MSDRCRVQALNVFQWLQATASPTFSHQSYQVTRRVWAEIWLKPFTLSHVDWIKTVGRCRTGANTLNSSGRKPWQQLKEQQEYRFTQLIPNQGFWLLLFLYSAVKTLNLDQPDTRLSPQSWNKRWLRLGRDATELLRFAQIAYLFSAFALDTVFSTSVSADQTCESSATVHGGGRGGGVHPSSVDILLGFVEQTDLWWPLRKRRGGGSRTGLDEISMQRGRLEWGGGRQLPQHHEVWLS